MFFSFETVDIILLSTLNNNQERSVFYKQHLYALLVEIKKCREHKYFYHENAHYLILARVRSYFTCEAVNCYHL